MPGLTLKVLSICVEMSRAGRCSKTSARSIGRLGPHTKERGSPAGLVMGKPVIQGETDLSAKCMGAFGVRRTRVKLRCEMCPSGRITMTYDKFTCTSFRIGIDWTANASRGGPYRDPSFHRPLRAFRRCKRFNVIIDRPAGGFACVALLACLFFVSQATLAGGQHRKTLHVY